MSTQVLTLEHESKSPGVLGGGGSQKVRLAIESDALTNPAHLANIMGAAVVAMETLLGRGDLVDTEVADEGEQPDPSPDDEAEMDEARDDGHEPPIRVTLPHKLLPQLRSLELVPVPDWAVREYISRGVLLKGI